MSDPEDFDAFELGLYSVGLAGGELKSEIDLALQQDPDLAAVLSWLDEVDESDADLDVEEDCRLELAKPSENSIRDEKGWMFGQVIRPLLTLSALALIAVGILRVFLDDAPLPHSVEVSYRLDVEEFRGSGEEKKRRVVTIEEPKEGRAYFAHFDGSKWSLLPGYLELSKDQGYTLGELIPGEKFLAIVTDGDADVRAELHEAISGQSEANIIEGLRKELLESIKGESKWLDVLHLE